MLTSNGGLTLSWQQKYGGGGCDVDSNGGLTSSWQQKYGGGGCDVETAVVKVQDEVV